jgi:hypothetical protein
MEEFDYSAVQKEFARVMIATGNRLDREWPERRYPVDSARLTILTLFRLAVDFHDAVIYLCYDENRYADWHRLYCLTSPPLNRTILEIIVSVLYLLEDLETHTRLFYKAVWREKKETIEHNKKHYAGQPKWDEYIALTEQNAAKLEAGLITPEEKANLQNILRWPSLSKVIKRLKRKNPELVAFIEYLDDWLYRELSSLAHAHPLGFMEMSAYFVGKHDLVGLPAVDAESELISALKMFRTKQMWIAMTLLLSLASEIEIHFRFSYDQDLSFLWTMFNNYSDIPKEIYERRYAEVLVPIRG